MPTPEDKTAANWPRVIACGLVLFVLGLLTGLFVQVDRAPLAVIRLDPR